MSLKNRDMFRPAQIALIDEMLTYPSGIAELGMGGGKTVSALTAFTDWQGEDLNRKAIVLAPARTVDNVWPNEPAKWDHLQGLKVVAVSGTPTKRKKMMDDRDTDVYVVSIDNTKWLIEYLKKSDLDLGRIQLFIDEISRFKNPRSVRGKALFKIAGQFAGIWGLTGTPRPNGYTDLWMQIRIVSGDPAVWGKFRTKDRKGFMTCSTDYETWLQRHFYPQDYQGYDWTPHKFQIPVLDAVANEWMVKGSVNDLNLRSLNTGDDFVRWTDMSAEQDQRYEEMMKDMITEGQSKGLSGDVLVEWLVDACSQGVVSGKLTQIVQGFLYRNKDDMDPYIFKDSPKLSALVDMDSEIGYDKAVIVYGYRQEIPILTEALKSHRTIGLLGGGVSTKKANQTIEDWNTGKIDRLLLHPASAGHGIELQFGGHHMVWYHPTWSSELYDQTIKRLHRPGQEKEVFNWQIAMRQTNDEVKLARVMNKSLDASAFSEKLRSLV